MEKKKEQVLNFLEKMEIEAQSLVNRGVRYYAKPATEMLPFAKLALEVVRELWSMYELWAKCPVDVEAITFFAEKIKSHYPHTKSICSTIDKELAAFRETRAPADSNGKVKEILQILHDIGGCDATDEYSKGWDEAIDTAFYEIKKRYGVGFVSNDEVEEDFDPDAHTCDYSARGECKICGEIRYKSPLWFEIYGGEP